LTKDRQPPQNPKNKMPNLFVICLIVVCALQIPLARSQSTLICNAQFLDIGGWCNTTNPCPDAYDYCANDNTGNGVCAPSYNSSIQSNSLSTSCCGSVCELNNRGYGAPCISSNQCPGYTPCINGVCTPHSYGAPCYYPNQWDPTCDTRQGLYCGNGYTCQYLPAFGEQCFITTPNMMACNSSEYFCPVSLYQCILKADIGQQCNTNSDCIQPGQCPNCRGTIVPSYCSASGICTAKIENGKSCNASYECISSYCFPGNNTCLPAIYSMLAFPANNYQCPNNNYIVVCSSSNNVAGLCYNEWGPGNYPLTQAAFNMFPDLASNWTQCAMYQCGLTSDQAMYAFYDPYNCMNTACANLVQLLNATVHALVAFSNGDYSALPSYFTSGQSPIASGSGGGSGGSGGGLTPTESGHSNTTTHINNGVNPHSFSLLQQVVSIALLFIFYLLL
jgi:hypothetical protein